MPRSCVRLESRQYYFPEEVIFIILSWTNATSLRRFKSVCKLWRSIISNKKFIEFHNTNTLKLWNCPLSKNSHRNLLSMMITYHDGKNYNRNTGATIVYSDSPKNIVNLGLHSPFDDMEVVSSCNGIVCLHDARSSDDDIYLLNPLTRVSKRLPIFHYSRRIIVNDVAFGFDCVTHEYKVLRIMYQEVYLCSSNANSWRKIEINTKNLPRFGRFLRNPALVSGPVVDGVLYLKAVDEILMFDMHDEIFVGLIPFPSSLEGRWVRNKSHVMEFEGCVAVFFESGVYNKDISLWTMEVVSGKVDWNKILSFDAGLEIEWMYMYSGAKQFVGKLNSGEIVLCDYEKKKTKCIEIPSQNFTTVLDHTENFLPI